MQRRERIIRHLTNHVKRATSLDIRNGALLKREKFNGPKSKKDSKLQKNNYVVLEKEEIDKIELSPANAACPLAYISARLVDRIGVSKSIILFFIQYRNPKKYK